MALAMAAIMNSSAPAISNFFLPFVFFKVQG